jgi:hypothetical protein
MGFASLLVSEGVKNRIFLHLYAGEFGYCLRTHILCGLLQYENRVFAIHGLGIMLGECVRGFVVFGF